MIEPNFTNKSLLDSRAGGDPSLELPLYNKPCIATSFSPSKADDEPTCLITIPSRCLKTGLCQCTNRGLHADVKIEAVENN